MKKEQFDIATKEIHSRVKELVLNQLPTLDGIMQVDKMSPEDRVFYEAYKKYGNRNHTWQDFKAMFNGDIATMQETIKHWKTWDKINDLYSKMHEQVTVVRALLAKYDIKSISEERPAEYAEYKNKYPDLVDQYEKYTKIEHRAHANYCTFDPEISKLERRFEKDKSTIPPQDKNAIRELTVNYIQQIAKLTDLRNANFVTGERIETYKKIIFSNPDILHDAENFDNLSASDKVNLARKILNASALIHGTPIGQVTDDEAPDGPHILTATQGGGYSYRTERFLLKGSNHNFSKLGVFLATLAHEDAHRIDHLNPEFGMIGNQIMQWQNVNYYNNDEIGDDTYCLQPTEQSSYYMDQTIAAAVSYNIKPTTKDR